MTVRTVITTHEVLIVESVKASLREPESLKEAFTDRGWERPHS